MPFELLVLYCTQSLLLLTKDKPESTTGIQPVGVDPQQTQYSSKCCVNDGSASETVVQH